LGVPDFLAHQVYSLRSFELTFKLESIQEYVPAVDLHTFILECNYTIDYLVWMRWSNGHRDGINAYLADHQLKVLEEEDVPLNQEREERAFKSVDQINQYFSKLKDKKCICLALPFRNVWFAEQERQDQAAYVQHADLIQRRAQVALKEMRVQPKNLISFHWRFGEDSCAVYKNEGMDFCWGTSIFCWAKLTDVLFVIESVMKEAGILEDPEPKILYLAISNTFNPTDTLSQLQKGLSKLNVTIMRSTSLDTFKIEKDNYYISLIEQEICGLSKIFIASTWSTWSDYVVDWITVTKPDQHVFSMDSLFKKYGRNFSENNLFHLENS